MEQQRQELPVCESQQEQAWQTQQQRGCPSCCLFELNTFKPMHKHAEQRQSPVLNHSGKDEAGSQG